MLPIYRASARSARHLASSARLLSSASGDYLNNAKIPTFHFQDSLPRLPIPELKDTSERYLNSAAPLLSDAEFATTKKIMAEFESGIGKQLHETIVARDKARYSSFISEPWFDMYLSNRQELPLNTNPQLTFKDDDKRRDAPSRASALVVSSVKFFKTLKDLKLDPDMFHTQACMGGTGTGFFKFLNGKGGSDQFNTVCSMLPKKYAFYGAYLYGTYPLDMSQYNGLFNSTRVPGEKKDMLVKSEGNHVIIQWGHDFYKLDVMRKDGSVVPQGEIEHAIKHIISTKPDNDKPALGILTSCERTSWAKTRAKLLESPKNKASIADIDSALFAICLDDYLPKDFLDQQNTMLYGGGSKNKGRNRWYDKSFQMIVLPNGTASINFEHSWGDGVAVLRYFNEIAADAEKEPTPPPTPASSPPVKLEFDISPSVKADVEAAEKAYDTVCASVDHHCFEVEGFHADYIKSKGLGADGVLQMTFQLAHYNLYGKSAATYESANQSAYKHGRTETVRSCTLDSHAMCQVFNNKSSSNADKLAALTKAVKTHGGITKQALMGKGWDRHMFALKYEALQEGLELPAIYNDVSYTRQSEIILSTSTLASPHLSGGGFGPVGPNCYGIGYTTGELRGMFDAGLVGKRGFGAACMSYKGKSKEMVDAIYHTVEELFDVLGPMEAKKK
mmetsp:Transcript_25946/g.65404  ORF Transcript_25946/g.65404 Transcript_25946/m.65404 type:complete len:674 (+) Transcript_25946:87-2108(+)